MNQVETTVVAAAAPNLIAALEAFQQFETDMGNNPANWVVNYPGAKLKLLGAVALQMPKLATAETGALMGAVTNVTSEWIAKLKAIPSPVPTV